MPTKLTQLYSRAGSLLVHWMECIGCPRSIRKDLREMEIWRPGKRLCACAQVLYTTMRVLYQNIAPAGTFLVARLRALADSTAMTKPARRPTGRRRNGLRQDVHGVSARTPGQGDRFRSRNKASEVAETLIAETLVIPARSRSATRRQRWTVGLQEQPAVDGQPGMALDKNTVFLITGAAGSIVSAITADLAAASGGTFYLLDLVPEPDPDNPDLKRFASDKEGLKRDLFARIQARGERATPALVEKELAALERAQAARNAIEAVARPAERRITSASTSPMRTASPRSSRRCASAAGVSMCCCTLPAWSAATFCRTRTRANSTWSSTSRAMAGSTCCTPSVTCRSGRRSHSVDCRPLRQRGTDRLQLRQRPAVQDHVELPQLHGRRRAASRSTGRRGAESGWLRAAPFRK